MTEQERIKEVNDLPPEDPEVDTTYPASEVRQQWSKIIERVAEHGDRILIEKYGAPVAAIISADDLKRLIEFEAERDRQANITGELHEAMQQLMPSLEHAVREAVAEDRSQNLLPSLDQTIREIVLDLMSRELAQLQRYVALAIVEEVRQQFSALSRVSDTDQPAKREPRR